MNEHPSIFRLILIPILILIFFLLKNRRPLSSTFKIRNIVVGVLIGIPLFVIVGIGIDLFMLPELVENIFILSTQQKIMFVSPIISLNPANVMAYKYRASCYEELGQYQKAIDDCTKAISIDPDKVSLFTCRGSAYVALQKYQEAIGDYTKAINLGPTQYAWNNAEPYAKRGSAYLKLGQYQKAIDDCNNAINFYHYAEPYEIRGNVYFALGQYQKAIDDYSRAINRMDYCNDSAYLGRASAYEKLGKHSLAEQDMAEAKSWEEYWKKHHSQLHTDHSKNEP